jgi:hypothetical protein
MGLLDKVKKKLKIENLTPAAIAWIVTTIMLLIGMYYEAFTKNRLGVLSLILFTSMVVYFSSLLYYRYRKK